ncbi:MAG TPA: MurT ligase domain-containing protein [Solirubrobacteraceae bacterium]|jgi:UDP-N-acetylmuramyl tripeptide synthase|nr:MurT ligase domain-containing protein [Solirubrobacteraceae bacterium]
MIDPRFALARAVAVLLRRAGRGATSLPGRLLIRLDPHALGRLGTRLPLGSALISATNGKTTTAALAVSILERRGVSLVHNRAGANMAGGVASALLESLARGGRLAGDLGLFEVDEFWFDRVIAELHPRALVLGNLFRDQLDRYGELDAVADRWAAVLASGAGRRAQLALNADDPLIADLGRDRDDAIFFGVEDDGVAQPGLEHASDSKHCRRCGAPYVYDAVYLGHLGRYHCPSCGASRPAPAIAAENVRLQGLSGSRFRLRTAGGSREVQLPLPGLYNVYNALAATALTLALGCELDDVVAGLESTRPAFGRAESVQVGARELRILLVKNPAGANEVMRTLALEPGEHDLLGILNDNVADGRDVSWIWDADFETLAPRVRRATCSGTRAAELALRLKYAGVPGARIQVQSSVPAALDAALADPRPGSSEDGRSRTEGPTNHRPLYAIPTYTAMLELREVLRARGHVQSSWA